LHHHSTVWSVCVKLQGVLGGITGFFYEPAVVPIFFAIDAMLALIGMIMGSSEPWAD
jgi:mannose/fructose/N-acetylgalactosamine-specific phosphotransferase system component IID